MGYSFKDTSKQDGKAKERVTRSVVSQLLKAQDRRRKAEAEGRTPEDADFVTGLSMTLAAVAASNSQLTVSATMAHNMANNDCSRFHFSHECAPVLIPQLQAVLSDKEDEVVAIFRSSIGEDGKPLKWSDISSNDYVFRPPILEHICYVQQTMHFKKSSSRKSNETGKCQSGLYFTCHHLALAANLRFSPLANFQFQTTLSR